MKKIHFALLSAIAIVLVFSSCSKEDVVDSFDTQSTQDNSKIQSEFDDINEIVQEAMEDEVSGDAKVDLDTCAIVTLNTESKTLTIDFGDGCTDIYGVERKGKIIASYTGAYKTEGSVITTTLEGYEVNGNQITGTKVVTNEGIVDGSMRWKVEVSDGMLVEADGDEITWESTRYRALVDEGSTGFAFDDTYNIWGTAEGVNRNSRAFTMTVTEENPLVIDVTCWLTTRLPTSGVITVSPDGLDDRSIDYGDEEDCDRKVTVTVGSRSIEVSL